MALRAALGAGRPRLVRQVLTESMLLSALGGAAAIFLANQSFSFLSQMVPPWLPELHNAALSVPVLLFTGMISLLTGVLFGLVPSLRISQADLGIALKQGSRVIAV